jgi:type II secretory pathway pseudopilin PulG
VKFAMHRRDTRTKRGGERGYILLAVLFLVMMVMITLALAAPKIAADIQRDREVEMVHRGQQYVRAIKLYYKKFGAYPPNLDALVKTNEIRFLRKRYKDPMTGKDDWHLIHFGENKTPSYGFFGQPIGGTGGSPVAGVGPGGMGSGPGALTQSNFGNSGAAGGSSFGGSSFGGSSFGGSAGGSSFGGSTGGSSFGNSFGNSTGGSSIGGAGTGTGGTSTGTDPNAPNSTGAATASGIGAGAGSTGGTDANGNPTGGGSTFGANGQTFGGGGVIGVESTSPKPGILIWKKKTHFNEWEFWYDPNADRMMISNNAGAIGMPAGAAGNGPIMGPGGLNSPGSAPPSQFGGSNGPTPPPSAPPQQ